VIFKILFAKSVDLARARLRRKARSVIKINPGVETVVRDRRFYEDAPSVLLVRQALPPAAFPAQRSAFRNPKSSPFPIPQSPIRNPQSPMASPCDRIRGSGFDHASNEKRRG
jgi:hypothetical protein